MTEESVRDEVLSVARAAKAASSALGQTTSDERNEALAAMAQALRTSASAIVEANARDMKAACGWDEGEPAPSPDA